MSQELFAVFARLLQVRGIKVTRLERPCDSVKDLDEGLRARLYANPDHAAFGKQLDKMVPAAAAVHLTDPFGLEYLAFRIPGGDDGLIVAGPYLYQAYGRANVAEMMERNTIPLHFRDELLEYYHGIPVVQNKPLWHSELAVFWDAFYGEGGCRVLLQNMGAGTEADLSDFSLEPDTTLSMAFIEERYQVEDDLLQAIRQSDIPRAMQHYTRMRNHRIQPRSPDPLRDTKNLMLVLNTLCRKAVQKGDVHPAHIDSLSTRFAKAIEACAGREALEKLPEEMLRRYCMLVRNHSLRGYSPLIQNAINYIDFNLTEPLSLTLISRHFTVNPSYLSARFRKETGETVTDTINGKRIHYSLALLNATGLSIQQIAGLAGFGDVNYFARLFKRRQGVSPRQYRDLVQAGQRSHENSEG